MIGFLINRPVAVLVSFFALFLLGLSAFFFLPTSLMPDTDIPEISIRLKADDYSANETEQKITEPLRVRLQQLRGLQRIESTSYEGSGRIDLIFEHGTNISLAFIEVNEKVDMAMNDLPREVERPVVNKASILNIPAFGLNVYLTDTQVSDTRFAELSNLARDVISRRIEQLPEVAMTDLTGTVAQEMVIAPRLNDLQALNITQAMLASALREHRIDPGNILVKDGHYQYFLHFKTGVYSTEDIASTPLNVGNRIFRLDDLADIRLESAQEKGLFFANGRRSINFHIVKQPAAKMDDLKKSFDALLTGLRVDYPDLVFEVTQDQRALLDYSVNNLQQDLVIGGILAFLCMLIFVRKWRPALLIGITIPLSLVISQLGFFLLDISLNVISLGGLILGLGMVIDNSIVVTDTISTRRDRGEPTVTAAVNGTNEILRPLITSVLTNCSVFIPLIFMSGIAGAIFYDQALSITIGVLSSLLVSVVLLPVLYVLLYSKNRSEDEIRARVNVTRWYEYGLEKVFSWPRLTAIAVVLFLGFGLLIFHKLDKQRIPPVSRKDILVNIDWNEQIDLRDSRERVWRILQMMTLPVVQMNVWAGEQQYVLPGDNALSYTQVRLYISVKTERQLARLERKLKKMFFSDYPLAVIGFAHAPNAFDAIFSNEQAPISLHLYNYSKRATPTIGQTVAIVGELRGALPAALINTVPLHNKLVLRIRSEDAAMLGVGINDIRNTLHTALKPAVLDSYQGAQSLIPIVLRSGTVTSVNNLLSSLFVLRREHPPVRLSELVDVQPQQEYQYFKAGIEGQYYSVDIETDQPAEDLKIIEQVLNKYKSEVGCRYTGSYFDNLKLTKDMMIVLLAAVILLYFILAAQFESLLQPLFILIELPIAISGALLTLWLVGNTLNLMSMIGIVVMCGLIINDSILKIDAINQARKNGSPLREAIYVGGHRRLKPMVMISFTSIGALLPTFFMNDLGSELQKPLALALTGGMLTGLLVSLFLVPLLYWEIYRRKSSK